MVCICDYGGSGCRSCCFPDVCCHKKTIACIPDKTKEIQLNTVSVKQFETSNGVFVVTGEENNME